MMNPSLLTFLIFLLICSNTFAQNVSSKEAKEFKTRSLIVGLEEMNPKKIKKLKPKELEYCKSQIEGNNYALKTAVEKYWKFNSTVEFLPLSEAKKLLKNKANEYALLSFLKYKDYEHFRSGAGWSKGPNNYTTSTQWSPALTYNSGTHYTTAANEIMTINIDMPSTIFSVNLPNLYVSLPDAVYGIKQMEYVFNRLIENDKLNFRDILKEGSGNTLKDKTLLLCKNDLDKKLDEEEIKNIYPYKYKIVTIEEIDKAIIDQDNECVIVQIVSVKGGKGNVSIHYLSDTSTGRIVGYVVPTIALRVKGTKLITYNEKIKEKHLKEYLEIANCK